MGNQRTTAVILIFVMLSAGCFGAVDDVAEEEKAPVVNELSLSVMFIEAQSSATLGEIVSLQISVQNQGEGNWVPSVSIYPDIELANTVSKDLVNIVFMPSEVVDYNVTVTFSGLQDTTIIGGPVTITQVIQISPPVEGAPILNAPSLILLEDSGLTWVSGSITHDYLDSCSLS